MRRRPLIFSVLAFVLGLGAIAFFSLRGEREPGYNGRTLSQWLFIRSVAASGDHQPTDAIHHIGTNALPWLLDYPASTASNELQVAVTYTLWIPDGVKTLRGIIVHQHGAGTTASIEGSIAAYDLHWQALEKKWDYALWGSSYHVQNEKIDISPGASELWFDPRRGSEKTFLNALTDFAGKSGHPEIDKIPWALWGHSGGGIWSDVMTTLHSDRVVGVWVRSGSALMFLSHPEFTRPTVPAGLYKIP